MTELPRVMFEHFDGLITDKYGWTRHESHVQPSAGSNTELHNMVYLWQCSGENVLRCTIDQEEGFISAWLVSYRTYRHVLWTDPRSIQRLEAFLHHIRALVTGRKPLPRPRPDNR